MVLVLTLYQLADSKLTGSEAALLVVMQPVYYAVVLVPQCLKIRAQGREHSRLIPDGALAAAATASAEETSALLGNDGDSGGGVGGVGGPKAGEYGAAGSILDEGLVELEDGQSTPRRLPPTPAHARRRRRLHARSQRAAPGVKPLRRPPTL